MVRKNHMPNAHASINRLAKRDIFHTSVLTRNNQVCNEMLLRQTPRCQEKRQKRHIARQLIVAIPSANRY